MQALTAIHLHSNYQVDLPGHGNIQYVNIFFVVALFILAVACINFMNLATARSARRAKEVGLRKVVGAGRKQLIGQFLGESLLISFLALLIAVGLVWLLLPVFNDLAGKELAIHLLDGKLIVNPVWYCFTYWSYFRQLSCFIPFWFSAGTGVERKYEKYGWQFNFSEWAGSGSVCCFHCIAGRYGDCVQAAYLYQKHEPGL